MRRTIVAAVMCIVCAVLPLGCLAGGSEATDSSYWAGLVHQENSIVASVLYLPYLFLKIPYRIVDGIVNPTPTTQATVPPAAHVAK
ncbi:MAG TPA: hypothetical protein VK463_01640 [Desulfomonilaceae bacterium]|nr:hypothetical protein [Desulfomonilaceae bacterium]